MALPDAAEQTPLEQLQAMNEQVGKTRRRKAKPAKDPSRQVERFMRAQLQSLVRAINKEVEEEVVPVIEQTEEQYRQTTDSVPTMDGWADRVIGAINSIANRYTGPQSAFWGQYERLAQRTVSMAEAESTEAFVKSVNQSVGVDLNPVLNQEGMSEYLEVATQSNAELISSVPDEYINRVKSSVWGGVRNGDAPKKIRDDIRNATGVTENQAKRIARDQSAKLTSEITERRQTQAGVKYYRVSTAGDNRVTGKPGGKYPNAKISCWGISQQDVGYGKGVYRWDEGASWGGQTGLHPGRHHIQCRCTATPVFEYEVEKGEAGNKEAQRQKPQYSEKEIRQGNISNKAWNNVSSGNASINRSVARANPTEKIKKQRQEEIRKRLSAKTEKQKRAWLSSVTNNPPPDEVGRERRLLDNWVRGSRRKVSVEMKQAAIEEFGSGGIPFSRRDFNIDDAVVSQTRQDLRGIYNKTQQELIRQGRETVTLYRGLKTDVTTPGAVESWTTNRKIAESFNGGRVIKKEVPRDKILTGRSIPGWNDGPFGNQEEYLVLGGG